MRKSVLIALGIVLLISLILTGCTSSVTTTATSTTQITTTSTATVTATPTVKNGGTLRVGWTGWPAAGMNPFLASDEDDFVFLSPIYEPIVMPLEDGTIQPWIAQSWEYNATANEWVFHLNPKAHWSDGQPLTANDVKFTFDSCWQYKTDMASELKSYVSSIEVIDNNTVGFKMAQACAPFLTLAGSVLIMPQHIWASVGDVTKYTNPNPVGSGPFTFKEVQQGKFLDLVKDPNYWNGPAHIDELIIEVLLNDSASVVALEKGEVDDLPSMTTYDLVPTIEQSEYGKVYVESNPHIWYIAPNYRIYPLNLLQVRQAISLAIGRQDLIDTALSGYGVMPLMGYIAPSVTAWANTSCTWSGANMTDDQRIAQANALLDGLGFKMGSDGVRLTDKTTATQTQKTRMEFNLDLYSNPPYIRAAGIIQQDLAKIGIKIDISVYDPSTLYGSIIFSGEHPYDWDLLLHGSFTSPDPKDIAEQYAPVNPSSWDNGPAFGWPPESPSSTETQLVSLLQKSMTDMDATVRYNDIQQAQTLFADDLTVITLGHKYGLGVYSTANFIGWNPVAIHYDSAIHPLASIQNYLSVSLK
jgi:peptide/nickel transport system substrate-binding protein